MSIYRSQYAGEVTEQLDGQTVKVAGWVHRRRDHGGVIFIDLRDRSGLVQVVIDPDTADISRWQKKCAVSFVYRLKVGCGCVQLARKIPNLQAAK